MLASITPLGERGRRSSWGVTVSAFALGASVAGAAAGALAGCAGERLLPSAIGSHTRLAALAAALLLAATLDARADSAPGPRRQVNERWLDEYRGWVYGLGFGAQLGLGLTTVVTSAATYVALLAAALSGSVARGAVIVGVFGAVRGLTPLVAARVRSPRQLRAFHFALGRLRTPSRWVAVAGLAACALIAGEAALA